MKPVKTTLAVCVTGGIGSGKSELCRVFATLGAKVLYADTIAKEVISTNSEVRKNIVREFGEKAFLPDGTLNRELVSKLTFNDQGLRTKLDAIVHPPTLQKIREALLAAKHSRKHPMILVETALAYESGADELFDYMLVVEASEAQQIGRVVKRDKMLATDVRRRIMAQMPTEEKSAKADFVIYNTGDLKTLEANCKFLFSLFTKMSERNPEVKSWKLSQKS